MSRPASFAFFDVDETLVSFKTMFSFVDYYFLHTGAAPQILGRVRRARFHARMREHHRTGRPRELINAEYYRTFRGRAAAELRRCARDWFREVRWRQRPFYLPATLDALHQHQSARREIVFVSGSSIDILAPIASELGVTHVLATRQEEVGGVYTGEIEPPQTIGAGKAEAVRRFLAARGNDGSTSFAYGDHDSDIPMLSTVGNPVVVSRHGAMRAIARERAWPVLDPYELGA